MKSKIGKGILIILASIVILGVAFFTIDLIRVKQEKNPIFAIPIATYKDGGTKEYLGLGYKVIDYHAMYPLTESEQKYYDDLKIGTYFMKYKVPNKIEEEQNNKFKATIISVNGNSILVEADEGESIRSSSDKFSMRTVEGQTYVVGEMVEITHTGIVRESYPAQIDAISIRKIKSKISQMYEVILTQLMKEDIALNENMQYIAVDLNSFVRPSLEAENIDLPKGQKFPTIDEKNKNDIIAFLKNYHTTIKQASFKDLKEQGLFDEKQVSIEGILISVESVEKLTENKAVIRIKKYKGGLSAVMPKYELNYKNGQWNIKTIDTMIS